MFALYPRLRAMAVPGYEAAPDKVRLLPERLSLPMSWNRPRRVFVNSMSDPVSPARGLQLYFGCVRCYERDR